MSDGFILTVLVAWVAIGVVLLVVFGRRGHDGWSWFLLGAMLGPVALLFAMDSAKHDEQKDFLLVRSPPADPEGVIDVLIGIDDSPEARAAIDSVVALFGDRLRRLTLGTVISFDEGAEGERLAVDRLEGLGAGLAWLAPELVLLYGHPATALARHAEQCGFHVLAVGAQSRGRHLFGRTASELVATTTIPVLVGGLPHGVGRHVEAVEA